MSDCTNLHHLYDFEPSCLLTLVEHQEFDSKLITTTIILLYSASSPVFMCCELYIFVLDAMIYGLL